MLRKTAKIIPTPRSQNGRSPGIKGAFAGLLLVLASLTTRSEIAPALALSPPLTNSVHTFREPPERGAVPTFRPLPAETSPRGYLLPAGKLMVFETQRFLDSRGLSPGCLDGVAGPQTKAAWAAYQRQGGFSPGPEQAFRELPPATAPLFVTYAVQSNDLERLRPVPKTWLEKSREPRLEFETLPELLAETFHCSQQFIRLLNPGLASSEARAGTVVTVPNLSGVPVVGRAALVRIGIAEKQLEAFDAAGRLLVHFPCSIARRVEKRPLGNLEVVKLAAGPNYLFDPENFPESEEARQLGRKIILPPGPNNPVGTAWIGLNRPGYGIHGTPWPEEIGRTESHGCFRLANWNAELLLKLVVVGTPVLVEP